MISEKTTGTPIAGVWVPHRPVQGLWLAHRKPTQEHAARPAAFTMGWRHRYGNPVGWLESKGVTVVYVEVFQAAPNE